MALATTLSAGQSARLRPGLALKLIVLAALILLIVAPMARTVLFTFSPEAVMAWSDVLVGRLAPNLFWWPLVNTMLIGVVTAAACVLIGGFLAWAVVMTDIPFRRTIGVMATLPFMIPSFATALAWGGLFRNDRIGGDVGFL
jgi:iron(III) transport system permease protein